MGIPRSFPVWPYRDLAGLLVCGTEDQWSNVSCHRDSVTITIITAPFSLSLRLHPRQNLIQLPDLALGFTHRNVTGRFQKSQVHSTSRNVRGRLPDHQARSKRRNVRARLQNPPVRSVARLHCYVGTDLHLPVLMCVIVQN
jgi:hypothetical protein